MANHIFIIVKIWIIAREGIQMCMMLNGDIMGYQHILAANVQICMFYP